MSQAAEFPILLNRIGTLFDVEVCVNAMTDQGTPYVEQEAEREYKAVSVDYTGMQLHGASKSLFIQIMMGLVLCGKPEQLRVEWAPDPFTISQDDKTVSAHLMVRGHPAFMEDWGETVNWVEDIRPAVAARIEDAGVSHIALLNIPDPKAHTFITPSDIWSARALFVSLMLSVYDCGELSEHTLTWRDLPTVKIDNLRKLWTGSARAVIQSRQRIVVPT